MHEKAHQRILYPQPGKLRHNNTHSFTEDPTAGIHRQICQHKIDSNNHQDQERGPSRICTEKRELSLEQGRSQGASVNCVLIFFFILLLWTNLKFWELQHPLEETGCWHCRYFKKRNRHPNEIFINKRWNWNLILGRELHPQWGRPLGIEQEPALLSRGEPRKCDSLHS